MVNLRRAVVLAFFLLFCIVSVICGAVSSLYASNISEVTLKGGASLVGYETWLVKDATSVDASTYSFIPYLQVSYSSNSVKSEFKFHFDVEKSYLGSTSNVVLDKSYVRFRIPTVEGNKLTIIAGKAPVSWGIGQLYRGGDLLFSSVLSNDEAGQEAENNLWVVSVAHPLFDGASLDLAFVPAVESVEQEKLGTLFKFSLGLEVFKEVRLAYVYSDSKHRASALVDLNLYFDINVAVETSFRSSTDFRVVANLYKTFSLEGEYESHALSFYASYQGDFYEEVKEQDLSFVLSYELTDRTTISLLQFNSWVSGDYKLLACSLYSTSVLANGIELTILGFGSLNPASPTTDYSLSLGARVKYSF